jgi:hypothetical protein
MATYPEGPMSSMVKRILGIGCALCGSTLLVLSLVGAVGPGCGSSSSGDLCDSACKNYKDKCGMSSSVDASDEAYCVYRCTVMQVSSSLTTSSKDEYRNMFDCVARATSCRMVNACTSY